MKKTFLSLIIAGMLSGCAGMVPHKSYTRSANHSPVQGPIVVNYDTMYSSALECLGTKTPDETFGLIKFSVGDIKDQTGKISNYDGGSKFTQGATSMIYSALGKIEGITAVERTDIEGFKLELELAKEKLLGDEKTHQVGKGLVSWKPLIAGSVIHADYTISGTITEANFNIFSGGAELYINGIGGGVRKAVMDVGIDLRVFETGSLKIVDTVSLRKQVVGYETKAGTFHFFGIDTYVDFNSGEKTQEPIQEAVREIMERGVIELVGSALKVDTKGCISTAETAYANKFPTLSEMQEADVEAAKVSVFAGLDNSGN